MTSIYLALSGAILAIGIAIAKLFRSPVTYHEPMPWQMEDYSPRQTTIQADFITKRDEA